MHVTPSGFEVYKHVTFSRYGGFEVYTHVPRTLRYPLDTLATFTE